MHPSLALSLLLPLLAVFANADITPTTPGPDQLFKAGSPCTMTWTPDSQGTWKNVNIYLMSGSNNNMTVVATVAQNIDGTSDSSYSWTCPEVDPFSAIYFYQFTNGDDKASSKWTTRFTITSVDGTSTPPEQSSQPNGDLIPWGIGALSSTNSNNIEASSIPSASTSTSATIASEASSTAEEAAATLAEPLATSSRMHKARPTAQNWDPDTITPLSMPAGIPQGRTDDSPRATSSPALGYASPQIPYNQGSYAQPPSSQQVPQSPYAQMGPPAAPYIHSMNSSSKKPSGESVKWMILIGALAMFVMA